MQRRQYYKLSSLNEEQIEKELDNLTLDDLGTDNEEDDDFDSDDDSHKWGVKLFVLSDSFGFSYSFEIYCGAGDNVVKPGSPDLGAAANVLVRLSRIVPDFKNHIIYFDNYYTSLPLLVYIRARGIFSLGTIRSNRIPNCKLPTDNDLKKHPRGYSTEFCGSAFGVDISSLVWKDNKAVRLVSTYVGKQPLQNQTDAKTTASRYVRSEKKYVDVDCPNIINEYNSHMGGVDLMDGLIGRYKINMKSNKYTNRIFYHLLDLTMVNAYILFKRINKPDSSDRQYQLPNFRSEVAHVLCTLQNPSLPKHPGRPRTVVTKKILGQRHTYHLQTFAMVEWNFMRKLCHVLVKRLASSPAALPKHK